jgi:hypothetical protein
VLHEQPRDRSLARDGLVFASPAMIFTPQGLMLGAGTILVRAEGTRKLRSLKGREQQVLALLSAAYGRAIAPSILGNIERAAKSWSQGDDFTAHIHLAHTGLRALDDFPRAAHRLRMAKGGLDHGASPRDVFEALRLDAHYIDALEKQYDPAQPRVPAGHGQISGQWTSGDWSGGEEAGENAAVGEKPAGAETQGSSVFARMPLPVPPPPPSVVSGLTPYQVLQLGLFAARVLTIAGGATVAFGLLFIPSPDNVHVEEDVEGLPGWRYSWNRDETTLYLKYDHPGVPQRTVALRINDKDEVLDEKGRVVGKVIGGNKITIDTVAVLPDVVRENEPKLCPAYEPDVPGSDQGKPPDENRSRQYEDFVKLIINPPSIGGPTPSGFAYYLPRPIGDPVSFDDCQWKTGFMVEIKAETYTHLLSTSFGSAVVRQMLDQSARQIAASGGRPIVWVFAEEEAALRMRKVFDGARGGREKITIVYIPWVRSNP